MPSPVHCSNMVSREIRFVSILIALVGAPALWIVRQDLQGIYETPRQIEFTTDRFFLMHLPRDKPSVSFGRHGPYFNALCENLSFCYEEAFEGPDFRAQVRVKALEVEPDFGVIQEIEFLDPEFKRHNSSNLHAEEEAIEYRQVQVARVWALERLVPGAAVVFLLSMLGLRLSRQRAKERAAN